MNDYVDPEWANAALLTIDTQQNFDPGGARRDPGHEGGRASETRLEAEKPLAGGLRPFGDVSERSSREHERGLRVQVPQLPARYDLRSQ
jgi:hypothetical protein